MPNPVITLEIAIWNAQDDRAFYHARDETLLYFVTHGLDPDLEQVIINRAEWLDLDPFARNPYTWTDYRPLAYRS